MDEAVRGGAGGGSQKGQAPASSFPSGKWPRAAVGSKSLAPGAQAVTGGMTRGRGRRRHLLKGPRPRGAAARLGAAVPAAQVGEQGWGQVGGDSAKTEGLAGDGRGALGFRHPRSEHKRHGIVALRGLLGDCGRWA